MTDSVRDDSARRRFELEVSGAFAFIDYRRDGGKLLLTHAEVPLALRGLGVGSALVKGTLDLVRQRGEKVVPLCSFVAHYMEAHPEVQDLLANEPS
jgi:uncharacterized protein